jgi:hypothetical protein
MLSFDSKAARQAWTYAEVILVLCATYMIRKTCSPARAWSKDVLAGVAHQEREA